MINEFFKALVYDRKSDLIPEEQNWFGNLVGEWDFEWIDNRGTAEERRMKGEWLFSWILEGAAIQDVFICPSRSERLSNKQPDAAYATTIRIYNAARGTWDVFYGNSDETIRMEAQKEGDQIVLTEIGRGRMKWTFSNLKENSFHWQNTITQDGKEWVIVGELFATRKAIL